MKLTHHSTPSRSFILLTFIVLCAVYAALVLTRINRVYEPEGDVVSTEQSTESTEIETVITDVDTSDWGDYNDDQFPLIISHPESLTVGTNTELEGYYIVNLSETTPRTSIKIFISDEGFAGTAALAGSDFITNNGYAATNYDNIIYTIKVGEYFYTFDGTNAPDLQSELAEIVNSATLD